MAALTLETEQIGRSLKSAVAAKQQRLMEQDVRKLEVQRLRSVLNAKADEVFTHENQKFQLQQSLHERRLEIDVHKCDPFQSIGADVGAVCTHAP